VAGDVAPDVGGRHACLGAEGGDDAGVEVLPADALRPVGEQQVHPLAGLAVEHGGLGWSEDLPGGDGLPQNRVDWFGERGSGLVHWDVEQADGVVREHLVCVAWDGHVLTLPPYATDPQSDDLVAAQPAE
jgi:hypothetical protein